MTHYVIEDLDISEFKPSVRQSLAKLKLHQFVPGNVIGSLTPESITKLRGYLFPITVEEVMDWHISNKVFWFWFTIANEQSNKLTALKGRAVDTIKDILSGEVVDSKLAATQLKAAQLLLNMTDKPSTSVTNNNMHLTGGGDLPRALKKKSSVELQEELKKLETQNNRD